jgi:hypothetical protein
MNAASRFIIHAGSRPSWIGGRTMIATMIACLCIPLAMSLAEEQSNPRAPDRDVDRSLLEFTRVHVPVGRLSDIQLGTTRYVPMSAREFEEGIARLSAGGQAERRESVGPAWQPLADAARYSISRVDDGSLAGSVSFDVGGFAEASGGNRFPWFGLAREMPLGGLEVRSGSMRTGAGMGEAVVFGRRDGTVAVATPDAGTYTCDFRCEALPGAKTSPRFSIPLVPALATSIMLQLPRGVQPVVAGDLRARRLDAASLAAAEEPSVRQLPATVVWQIDTGPRATLDLSFVAADAASPMLSMWTAVSIRGRQSLLHVHVQPTTPWLPRSIRIEKDAEVLVTQVSAGGRQEAEDEAAWTVVEGGRAILIDLPPRQIGASAPLVIRAIAPVAATAAPLLRLRTPAEAWAGGGIAVRIVPSLTLSSIELEQCLIVPPEVATRWPLPATATAGMPEDAAPDTSPEQVVRSLGESEQDVDAQGSTGQAVEEFGETAPGVWPSQVFVEEQAAGATLKLSLLPRIADLDVVRVTTVDLSPGVVVGRAACDVRVRRGEAFDLTARITPGWFIDSIEAIALPTPAELADTPRRRGVDEPAAALDWKVLRDARGDMLRIGLIAAVTPARGLGLRITGHRAGIALGADFSTAEIDMVRLDGESERSAMIDLRTSPETTVEFPNEHASPPDRVMPAVPPQGGLFAVGMDGRLGVLMEEGAARARTWAGFNAESRAARLVRRRPPLDARTQVRLTVRDDRLTEAVTFECHPAASDLDSIVVQFSEPVDDPLEWSLLPPAVGTVSARRLDSADRRIGPRGSGSAGGERWLVELNPPAREPVTIRAARTIAFTRATPLLLAWVDGATSAANHCIVRNVGRVAPLVVNRRLSEVPPDSTEAEVGPVTVAEFSYDQAAAFDPAEAAAAELTPGDAEGRAWVWREITSSWCHASGATEYETLFDIDNHGRTSLALSLPAGHRVQGVLLDGVRLPLGERAIAGGQVPIELPAGRTFVTLLVRTVADGQAIAGRLGGGLWSAWRVDGAAAKLDVPVLQREWRLLLPPELEIASVGAANRMVGAAGSRDWIARLFAVRAKYLPATAGPSSVEEDTDGFRRYKLVPAGDAGRDAGVVVVHSRVVRAAAVIVGLVAGFGTLVVSLASLRRAVLVCLLAGAATLWIVAPFDGIARAAWWASLAALGLTASGWQPRFRAGSPAAGRHRGSGLVALVLAGAALATASVVRADGDGGTAVEAPSAKAAAAAPLQVFITPIDGGQGSDRSGEAMVLVPEDLFRALVRGEDSRAAAAVRVLAVRATATVTPESDGTWTSWRLEIDIDADAGGILLLDQSASGARFRPATLRIDGAVASPRLETGDSLLRVVVPEAGRHAVVVDVVANRTRSGEVETATIALPLAPVASLTVLPPAGRTAAAVGVVSEHAAVPGVFTPAPRGSSDSTTDSFDVSRSTQVRLARSAVMGVELASSPPTAVSRNDIFWNLDECRLTGVFEIEAGDAIVRSCVVTADAGLEWIGDSEPQDEPSAERPEAADGVAIRPLGGRRFLVERRRPERGRFRFEIPFRMPLADAVGVFDVPEAWLEDPILDMRSVRFVASPSLAVRIDLPPGLTHAATPEGEASFETRFWRGEVSRAGSGAAGVNGPTAIQAAWAPPAPRPRLTSERRRQEIRGSQRETVVFGAEQVRIRLDARLDASSTALVTIPLDVPAGSVVDRIELFEDDVLQPETAERGAIDLRWTRPTDARVAVVVQRPRAGRFRLEVDARIPGRPATRGPMPSLQVDLGDGSRSLIEWSAEDGLLATLERASAGDAGSGSPAGQLELVRGNPPPEYALKPSPAALTQTEAEPAAVVTAAERAAVGVGRVELADIRLAVDERGRVWGLACFELVSAERIVRLQLPQSWRLFDAVVDGRPVDCVVPTSPLSTNVWEMRLLDGDRPRTVVALFAGELSDGDTGRRLLDGEPFALAPPTLVGLPCRQVIWTVQVPADVSLRVAAPARIVADDAILAERRAALQRLEADFQQAIESSAGWQQDRVRTFLESRRDGAIPAADQAWARSLTGLSSRFPAPPPATIFIVAGESADAEAAGRLTIRAVRQRDPTTRGRAIATLSLLTCGGLIWLAARRQWSSRLPTVTSPGPAIALVAGLAWIALLVPEWPGWLLAAGAAVALAMQAVRRRQLQTAAELPAAIDIAEATTIYRPQR